MEEVRIKSVMKEKKKEWRQKRVQAKLSIRDREGHKAK